MIGNLLMPGLEEFIATRDFNGVAGNSLRTFRAPDIAEIFVDLHPGDEAVLLRLLPRELAAEVFEYLPLEDQEKALQALGQRAGRANLERHRARMTARRCCRNCPPPRRRNCSRC